MQALKEKLAVKTNPADACWKFRVIGAYDAFMFTNSKEKKALLLTRADLKELCQTHKTPRYVDIPRVILLSALGILDLSERKKRREQFARAA